MLSALTQFSVLLRLARNPQLKGVSVFFTKPQLKTLVDFLINALSLSVLYQRSLSSGKSSAVWMTSLVPVVWR